MSPGRVPTRRPRFAFDFFRTSGSATFAGREDVRPATDSGFAGVRRRRLTSMAG